MTINKPTTQFKKYPAYKDSGVDWLGEIPEGWELKKVKNIFQLIIDPAPKNNNYELLSVYTEIGVKPRKELKERGNKASTTDGYWIVKKGDIIVNKLLAWMGAIGISKYDGVTSPAYDILRAKLAINGDYYHYLFRTSRCISELKKHSRGIMEMRLRLYFDKFGDVLVPYPSEKQQKTIANYLDKKTAQIDKAISQKQKLIELLKERQQITIQNAVTKGVNSKVKLKDSGVDWIGGIPEHWEVKRLASMGRFSKGGGFSKSDLIEVGEPAVLYGDIYTKYNIKVKHPVRFISENTSKNSIRLVKNQLLFTGSGETKEDIGKCVVYINSDTAYAGGDVIIYDQKGNNSLFLSYVLNTHGVIEQKAKTSKGEIIVHTYGSKLRNIYLAIPNIEEQKLISEHVENQTKKTTKAINLQQQSIEKLKEYKATLINSAVTGKIKIC